MVTVARLLGIGWYVALCIVAGILGGRWLDGTLETSPLFTLVGLLFGLALAMIGMYRMLTAVLSESSNSANRGNG